MAEHRFDRISRIFANRRVSRRQAIAAGTGLAVSGSAAIGSAVGSAQEATPAASPEPMAGGKTTYLFVQSFQSGAITPVEGTAGRYTVTLEQGTGQTIYFGDRPSRDVGVTPTPEFLAGLGFSEDNPPNAAIILETGAGDTDVAVVELFSPVYDETTRGVTYEAEVLQNWQEDLDLGLREGPADLAAMAPSFGAAHLLIDDCPSDMKAFCKYFIDGFWYTAGSFSGIDSCWNYSVCMPCEPYGHTQPSQCATPHYWDRKCNDAFPRYCQDKTVTLDGCKAEFTWTGAGVTCEPAGIDS